MLCLRRSLPIHVSLGILTSLIAACAESNGGGGTGPTEDTGSISASAVTTGVNLDADGYTVTVGSASQALPTNGTVTFTGVATGSRSVMLSGVADNCDVTNSNPQSATVEANQTASVSFTVVCGAAATPTALAVTSLEDALFDAINALNDGTVDELDQFSFEATRQLFQAAVDADPTNETAQFGLAVTTIFVLEDNTEIRDLADRWEVWLDTHSMDDLSGLNLLSAADPLFWSRASLPLDIRGNTLGRITDFDQIRRMLLPRQMAAEDYPPTLSEHQALLRDVIAPELEAALAALNSIDDPLFAFIITERMQGETEEEADPLELDLTEILALRAALEGSLALTDAALAYVTEPSPWGAAGFAAAFETGSTFATLATDGAELLLDAQERVVRGIGLLEDGLDNLVAEADDQSDDIIKYDPTGSADGLDPQNVEDARGYLADAKAAAQGPRTITEDLGWGEVSLVVDASKFFTDPIPDLKAILPDYEVMNGEFRWAALTIDEWAFPDPTFHGILPEITSNAELLNETLDLRGLYWDFAFPQGNWQDITLSLTSGYLAFASEGYLGIVSTDFSSVTFAPTNEAVNWNGADVAVRVGTPEIIAMTYDGVLFARPDDEASPWTEALQTLASHSWIDLTVSSVGILALNYDGGMVQVDAGLTTHTVLPNIGGSGFVAMTTSGSQVVALTYYGELFITPDPSTGWEAESTLVDLGESWAALARGPSGSFFVATETGSVRQISDDFTSSLALPSVPVSWGLLGLTTNDDASQLVAMTNEGQLFSRPTDEPTVSWVTRSKIPRVRNF
jgi:hypothetical protein